MTYLNGILLGILQGISEFLPISSSGHLIIARNLLGLEEIPVLFDVLLHVATLLVICFVFRSKILKLFYSLGRWLARKQDDSDKDNLKTIVVVLIATAVTGVLGYLINEIGMDGYPHYVSLLFGVTGLILIGAHFVRGHRNYGSIRFSDGLLIGLAQGLGVFPGISRSGITISTARFGGLDSDTAGEISFIVSIPAIMGALILDLGDVGEMMSLVSVPVLAVSFLTTILVGYVSLKLLLRLLKSGRLFLFSLYLLPAAVVGYLYFS